jgi:hypothetical protein
MPPAYFVGGVQITLVLQLHDCRFTGIHFQKAYFLTGGLQAFLEAPYF